MLQNFAGIFLVFIASTCSSVGMNFQKLAHRQTTYEDPRTCNKVRRDPRTDNVMLRPFMILGLIMSICAMVCDGFALLFTMSIHINVFVSSFLLF